VTIAQTHAPRSIAQAAAFVGDAAAARRPITIVGGDTLSGMGRPPQEAAAELHTTSLDRVVEYEPGDLTIGVEAGMRLQTLAATLSAQGQFVALDAPRAAEATVGGTLAAGWLGPRRHVYGRPRDALIGTTVVLADGTIARAGGMVVKNVAGYDLSRAYVGSFGTLALIARANLKTRALPKLQRMFFAALPEGSRARALAQVRALAVTPSAAWWVRGFAQSIDGDEGDDGRAVVLLEGNDALLERATRDVRSALGRAGVPNTFVVDAGAREAFARTLDATIENLGKRSVTYRIGEPVERAVETADAVARLCVDARLRCETIVDVMNGDVIARVSDLDARALGAKLEAFDDALHAAHPPSRTIGGAHPLRTQLQVWGAVPDAIALMRRLKQRFDPAGTFNPGRFVDGI
jgi:glycolate oxidase FAD binding subunit